MYRATGMGPVALEVSFKGMMRLLLNRPSTNRNRVLDDLRERGAELDKELVLLGFRFGKKLILFVAWLYHVLRSRPSC